MYQEVEKGKDDGVKYTHTKKCLLNFNVFRLLIIFNFIL